MTERHNPFVGPRPLEKESLHGRDREAKELINRLLAHRVVLLHSPSGAGKTSLLGAKVTLDLAKRKNIVILPLMRVGAASAPPGPRNPLVANLFANLPPDEHRLAAEAATFSEFVGHVTEAHPPETTIVLLLDQFEEVLSVHVTEDDRIRFFEDIGAALRAPRRWAVFSMREEFAPLMERYFYSLPTELRMRYRLDLLTKDQAKDIAQKTARDGGGEFEDHSLDMLIRDLASVRTLAGHVVPGEYVEPVHLQIAGMSLWEAPGADGKIVVRPDHTGGIADVNTALSKYYAKNVSEIAKQHNADERALRKWFDKVLISERGFRRPTTEPPPVRNAEAVLRDLRRVYLIRGDTRPDRPDWFELAHDRLIDPIRADNARHLTSFQKQADLWDERGRPEELLITGRRAWEEELDAETDVEEAFVVASRRRTWKLRTQWIAVGLAFAIIVAAATTSMWLWRKNRRLLEGYEALQRKIALQQIYESVPGGTPTQPDVVEQQNTAAEFLVEKYGWSRDNAERITAQEASQAQTADALLDVVLARLKPRTSPVIVEYYATQEMSAERGSVIKAMTEIASDHYTIAPRRGIPGSTNIIWYGSRYKDSDDVRLIALALIRAGVPLTSITPFRRNMIQVGFYPNLTDSSLTPDQIMREKFEELDRATLAAEQQRLRKQGADTNTLPLLFAPNSKR